MDFYQKIKKGQESLNEIPHQTEFSALCGYCAYNRDCPKFDDPFALDMEEELSILTTFKNQRASLDETINEREEKLKALSTRFKLNGNWINSNSFLFKVMEQRGRNTLDQHLLKENLKETAHLDKDLIEELILSSKK